MVLRVDSGEPSSLCSVAPNPQTPLLQNDKLLSCLWSDQCRVKSTAQGGLSAQEGRLLVGVLVPFSLHGTQVSQRGRLDKLTSAPA